MPQDNKVKELIINQLTKEQYKELKDNNQLSNAELYIISDNAYYTEEELSILLNTKQNKLIAGDGITIENDIITINLDDFYTSTAIDELLSKKSNISETGYNFDYTDNILTLQNIDGEELSSVKIVSMSELDNVTVNLNNSKQIQSIGEITRNGIPKYTWIGTQEEYDQAKLNGIITELTEVLITDSEAETVTPVVNYDAPTKLSELANDMDFVIQSDLQNVKDNLQNQIDTGIDDTNLVHKTGSEIIDGFKQFKEKIVIENTIGKGRIAHKPANTSLEDGYIEFGNNTLIYGKQNIQGELYDEKKNIFHEGNLIAGDNITIVKENDIYKLNTNFVNSANIDLSNLSAIGENKFSNKLNLNLDNLSEDGIKIIQKNSGGGLEIGDIGIAPLGIDETKGKRRYLNGQLIIQEQYVQFTNKVKSAVALYPSLACTEEEWQTIATMTVGGQVGKFVIDDEAGTIRLPKITMPIQGLTDLSKLAEIVEAGLPNIEGKLIVRRGVGNINILTGGGAFTGASDHTETWADAVSRTVGSNLKPTSHTFDASRSNSIYGNSTTVQQEQIQYPYFIQVATGAETEDNIVNEIELNNPFFLGMSQYFEIAPNNSSWLKSEGQWNAKAVYPTVYDWALINANNGIEGFKFITDEYTDYDYVINTADETFRLPLLNGSESILSNKYIDLTLEASGTTYIAPANGYYYINKTASATGQYITISGNTSIRDWSTATSQAILISKPVVKGEKFQISYTLDGSTNAFKFFYAQGNGSLYYYVGETAQNANLVNVGRIQETYATKSMVDGQWVILNEGTGYMLSEGTLTKSVAQTFDMNAFLPQDGYQYELMLSFIGYTASTSGNTANIYVRTDLTPDGKEIWCIIREKTQAGNVTTMGASLNVIVGTGRTITITNSGTGDATGVDFWVVGYRRLGTNK